MMYDRNIIRLGMKSFFKKYYPVLIICIFCIVYFNYLFFPKINFYATPDYGVSDIIDLHIPMKYLLYEALQSNTLPFWTQSLNTGFPLLGSLEIGALNPINLLLFKFFPFVIAFDLLYVVSFIINSLGTYLFCRKINISKVVSLYLSIIYSFSAYFIIQIPHTDILQTLVLLPWLFYFTNKIFNDNKKLLSVFLLSLSIMISVFATYPQITFISLLGILFFAIYLSIPYVKKKQYHRSILFIIAIIVGLMMGAAQIIPAFEFLQESHRANGLSFDIATQFSFPFNHLLSFIYPYALGNPANGTYPPSGFNGSLFWENTGYIGLIPLFFAFFSLMHFKKNKLVQFFVFLLFISFLFMLGKFSPIQFIYYFPGFSLFRVPSRFILLFIWSLVILSGIGFDFIKNNFEKKTAKYYSHILIIIIFIISILDTQRFFYAYNPLLSADRILETPKTVNYIHPSSGRVSTGLADNLWNAYFSKGWRFTNEIPYFNNFLFQDVNSLYGVNQASIYIGNQLENNYVFNSTVLNPNISITSNYTILLSDIASKLLLMENVKYIVTPTLVKGANLHEYKIAIEKNMPNIYLTILPSSKRVYIVHNKMIENNLIASTELQSKNFNPWKTVLLNKDDNKQISNENNASAKDQVSILQSTDQEIIVDAKTKDPGYLVIADNYYPGWEARVNGQKSNVLLADLFQKAIFLPSGESHVRLYYYPRSFFIGLYITITTLLVSLILLILISKKIILSQLGSQNLFDNNG